jgi:hypothetical protein
MRKHFPCPCCGRLVHDGPPGSYLICPICFWEDDHVQLRWPHYRGGANRPSLVEAQQNYRTFGVSEERFAGKVRPPKEAEQLDRDFRPIDAALDSFEDTAEQNEPWPEDRSLLYWWRPSFWRRPGRS